MKTFALVVLTLVLTGVLMIAPVAAQDDMEMVESPTVALTAPTQPSYVQTVAGPIDFGADFGLAMTEDDFVTFDSHATATQSVLAGEADFVGGSLTSHLLLAQAGQDFRVFCPMVSQDDFVLVGRNGVTEIEQIMDPEVRVAVDSPGGAGDIILNAMMQANGLDASVSDIPNTTVLESSGLRTNAWAADQIDATIIHLPQYEEALPQTEDGVIITSLYEDVPVFIKNTFAAPGDWLDENLETAAAFCASVLMGARELKGDFELYKVAVDTYVGEAPEEDTLREVFDLIATYDFWSEVSGLDPEAITFMAGIAVDAGVLEEVPDVELVYDPRPTDMALEMIDAMMEDMEETE